MSSSMEWSSAYPETPLKIDWSTNMSPKPAIPLLVPGTFASWAAARRSADA